MRHLSPEELLDLAEGILPGTAPATAAATQLAAHVGECLACREQVAELRGVVATVVDVAVPEPSPLFWDHLSARVREGVAADLARPALSWWGGGRLWRLTAAASIVAVVVAVSLTTGGKTNDPTAVDPVTVAPEATVPASVPSLDDDPSFGLIADLSGDVDWSTAAGAEMAQSVGVTDNTLTGLTDAERLELRRLLHEAMGTPGGYGGGWSWKCRGSC